MTKNPSQTACQPVSEEFASAGSPVDPALLSSPEYKDVAADIAYQLEISHARNPAELATGQSATRVMHTLGCASCQLDGVCSVESSLHTSLEAGRAAERREMLAS